MASSTTNAYLRDAVMTATPERLQLMLYDGAIRFATQARDALEAKRFEEAYDKFSRAQKIVLEMQQGLNHDVAPELCERMTALYGFVYRKLVEACVERNTGFVDEALEILQHQRQTWVLLMDKVNAVPTESDGSSAPPCHEAGSLSVQG